MQGQVCVVTGASRGIGRGIALQLCEAGATVYITGRHLDTLQVTAQEAQSRGAGVCLWCVIQARRVKCKAYFSRWLENSRGV